METKINGKMTTTAANNLLELANELQLPERGVAVAVNNKMVPRSDWEKTGLSSETAVTIIKAAYGG